MLGSVVASPLVGGGDFGAAAGPSCWLGTERWGSAARGDAEEQQLSPSAPIPLPQELSLSAGNVAGQPPCSGYVSY